MINHRYVRGLAMLACGFAASVTAPRAWADLMIEHDETVRGAYQIDSNVINQGLLAGLGPSQRIVVGQGYTLTGAGSLENVTVLGTYAPGNSPAIINGTSQSFGGTVEIELGGITAGSEHDQINDSAILKFFPTSTLSVIKLNNFIPTVGDTFTIFQWQTQLDGNFGSIMFDPFFANNGIDFQVNIINPSGTGSLVLNAITAVPEASQILAGAILCVLIGLKLVVSKKKAAHKLA